MKSGEARTFWVDFDRREKLLKFMVRLEVCVRTRPTAMKPPVPARGVKLPYRVTAYRWPWAASDTPAVFAHAADAATARALFTATVKAEQERA
jgi:hypothetical protein